MTCTGESEGEGFQVNTDGKVDWIHGKVDWILPRTIPYYKVLLLQYYKVLQSTTKYYKVLLQYYSVLQSTTPHYKVLQIATPVPLQSTTPHYKLLVHCTTKYYSMLQSTTPVLLFTAK